jgi:hypothetical protein
MSDWIATRDVSRDLLKKARAYASGYFRRNREYSPGHSSHLASEALEQAGIKYAFGHGVEGFCWNCGQEGISYINMGDGYDLTIYFDTRTEQFRLGCWADVMERLERQGITID